MDPRPVVVALRAANDVRMVLGLEPLPSLVARGGFADMTTAERSAKAKKQLRDKYGRFIEMGGHLNWKDLNGNRRPGRFLGVNENGNVLVGDPETKTIHEVAAEDVEAIQAKATIGPSAPKTEGKVAGNKIGDYYDLDGDGVIRADEARAMLLDSGEDYSVEPDALKSPTGAPATTAPSTPKAPDPIAQEGAPKTVAPEPAPPEIKAEMPEASAPLPAPFWKRRSKQAEGIPPPAGSIEYLRVNDTASNNKESRTQRKDLAYIPASWQAAFVTAGGRVEIFDGPVSSHPEMAQYRGVAPRGWPPGKTWDDIAGCAEGGTVFLGSGPPYGSVSIALHESGHAFDYALGLKSRQKERFSHQPEFVAARKAFMDAIEEYGAKVDPYFKQEGDGGLEETWAEAFSVVVNPALMNDVGWSSLPGDYDLPEYRAMLDVIRDQMKDVMGRVQSKEITRQLDRSPDEGGEPGRKGDRGRAGETPAGGSSVPGMGRVPQGRGGKEARVGRRTPSDGPIPAGDSDAARKAEIARQVEARRRGPQTPIGVKPALPESDPSGRGASFEAMGYQPHSLEDPEIRQRAETSRDKGYASYLNHAKRKGVDPPLTKDEYTQQAGEYIRNRFRGAAVTRAPGRILGSILSSDAVKSQFETGTSSGHLDTEWRRAAEQLALNVPDGTVDQNRPIYGEVHRAEDTIEGSEPYGDMVLRFGSSIDDRTTATWTDSLDKPGQRGLELSEITSSDSDPLTPFALVGGIAAGKIGSALTGGDPQRLLPAYHEVQIHGGATVDDVGEFHFPASSTGKLASGAAPYDESNFSSGEEYTEEMLRQLGLDEPTIAGASPKAKEHHEALKAAAATLEPGDHLVSQPEFHDLLDAIAGKPVKATFEGVDYPERSGPAAPTLEVEPETPEPSDQAAMDQANAEIGASLKRWAADLKVPAVEELESGPNGSSFRFHGLAFPIADVEYEVVSPTEVRSKVSVSEKFPHMEDRVAAAVEKAFRDAGITTVQDEGEAASSETPAIDIDRPTRVDREASEPESGRAPNARGVGPEAMGYQPPDITDRAVRAEVKALSGNGHRVYQQAMRDKGAAPAAILDQEAFEKAVADKITPLLTGEIVSRTPITSVGAILTSGALKTQFETGTSSPGGNLNPEFRRAGENERFNIPEDLPNHQRPVYAVSSTEQFSDEFAEIYGEVQVKFKPSVRERSTATFGDSLEEASPLGAHLSDLEDPSADPLLAVGTIGPKSMAQIADELAQGEDFDPDYFEGYWSPYRETQIHGGVPIEDIASMTISERSVVDSDSNKGNVGAFGKYDAQSMTPEEYLENALASLGITPEMIAALGPEAQALYQQLVALVNGGLKDGHRLAAILQFQTFINELVRLAGGDFKVTWGQ